MRQQAMPSDGRRVVGVDFSGANDAGRRIWLASGRVEDGRLQIESCCQASELPGSGYERAAALAAVRELLGRERGAVWGLDFPFSLPASLIEPASWEVFVLGFPGRFATPEGLRQFCRQAAGGRELKRLTDRQSRTPFSAYNLRLYRQTYYGLCDLLYPLVRDRSACVLPLQPADPDRPWVIEICPASTLKAMGLYGRPYKGRGAAAYAARQRILQQLEADGELVVASQAIRARVLDDPGGDALDSLVAALAVARALQGSFVPAGDADQVYALEGYVYV